jgi:ABC-type bacteriocin/lantibiotic exporter with double-glycine peptidase domain
MTSVISDLYRALLPARRKQLLFVVIALLIAAAFELLTISAIIPFLAMLSASEGATMSAQAGAWGMLPPGQYGTSATEAITGLFIVAVCCAAAMRILILRLSQKFVAEAAHDISTQAFSATLRQPYRVHVDRNSSAGLASIEKLQIIVSGVLLPLVQGVVASVLIASILILLIAIEAGAVAAAGLGIGLIYIVLALISAKALKRNSVGMAEASTARLRAWREAMGGVRDILLDNSYSVFEAEFDEIDRRFRKGQSFAWFAAQAPRFIVEAAGITLIALFAMYMAAKPGGLAATFPILGALALGAQRLMPLVQQVYQGATLVRGNTQIIRDVLDIIDAPASKPQSAGRRALISFRQTIVLKDMAFRFSDTSECVLNQTDLRIEKGDRVGLVGRSGSGKSTFLDLIMGFLEPSEGQILVDDEELSSATVRHWQSHIAHVPQSIYLADTTLSANIAFGARTGSVDEERVKWAAQQAQIHQFIETLPAGYSTRVGERGVRLSGGQRQRVALARALYRKLPLLILDEATSALDAETEREIMRSIATSNPGMTILIAAHRDSVFSWCNRILTIEAGCIRERPI